MHIQVTPLEYTHLPLVYFRLAKLNGASYRDPPVSLAQLALSLILARSLLPPRRRITKWHRIYIPRVMINGSSRVLAPTCERVNPRSRPPFFSPLTLPDPAGLRIYISNLIILVPRG